MAGPETPGPPAQADGRAARAAGEGEAIDGAAPRFVADPATPEALAGALAWAAAERLRVVVAGGRTKMQWGAPCPPFDLLLDTRGLHRVVEHRYGDLTATVEAGATLASVNDALGAHGQRLPWDPPQPDRATIGGLVATNDSGPLRHGHGAPRDAIIGVTMARADGRIAHAGGIVVKNVAGYDLARLLTGSFGSLGVILTATFKLAPRPPASRTVDIAVESLDAAAPIAADLAGSPLTPTAIEITFPPTRLLVRFESVAASAARQAEAACALVAGRGAAVVLDGADEQAAWDRHAAHGSGDGALVKLTTPPAALFPTLVRLRDEAAAAGLGLAGAGRAGLGVVDVRLTGDPAAQARVLGALRARLPVGRGAAVVRRADPAWRREVDAWGPMGDGWRVMQAIKRQFDPDGRLNPGRGPGGL